MGKNLLVQILKMVGVFLIFALLMVLILSAFPSLCGPVNTTSSYTVSNQDTIEASSQSEGTDSTNAEGDGTDKTENTSADKTESTHTVTNTTTEEMLLQQYNWIVWAGALLLTFSTFLIDANNRTQRYKAEIPKRAANIAAAAEKCGRLISQANRFVDKYAAHEGDIMKNVAAARSGASTIKDGHSLSGAAQSNGAVDAKTIAAESASPVRAPQVVYKSSDFRAVLESYPTLLANQNTQLLLSQLERSEAAILTEKNAYNEAVAKYNTEIHTFPFVLLRGVLKLQDQQCYAGPDAGSAVVTDEMLGI